MTLRPLLPCLFALILVACDGDDGDVGEHSSASDRRKMNISCFVYRDDNRNGVYDMSDRPYSGLMVRLTAEDGSEYWRKSNLSGFANFAMSAGNERHPISAPGEFRVQARPESGWSITSDNADQNLRIVSMDESPGGLVASATLEQVGVAPDPVITGFVSDSVGAGWLLRPVADPGREPVAVEPDEAGGFSVPATVGEWQVLRRDADGPVPGGVFSLGSRPVHLADIARPFPHRQGEYVQLDFDDLTGSDTLYEIPSGYGGLDWHNWIATHHKFYNGYGYINATTSGEFSSYNSSGHPAEFSSSKPFDVFSVNLGVAWPRAESADIHLRAWRGGELAYHDRLRATTSGAKTVIVNYQSVTRVEIATETYWQVVIDDLVVSPPGG